MNDSNDQILIRELIQQKKDAIDPELKINDYFELYSCSEILKNYDLSIDEIKSGLIGGSHDGGLDGFFIFHNSELLLEDKKGSVFPKHNVFDLYIVQSKYENGFSEEPLHKIAATLTELFDLSKSTASLASVYNEGLLEIVSNFKATYKKVIGTMPRLSVKVIYVTIASHLHDNVKRKVKLVEDSIKKQFDGAEIEVSFLGAKELMQLARQIPKNNGILEIEENLSTKDGSYVALVPLKSLNAFITDDNSLLRKHIFDANVRDYQGNVTVNSGIQQTLDEPGEEDFWHLNNGLSILCDKASLSGKLITVENPQIVNGLQSSYEIYNYFRREPGGKSGNKRILVRIIADTDPVAVDRVIKATNSQTPIPPTCLWGSDQVQRNIESYLLAKGYFYERRKNHYKNDGKPNKKLISIKLMAQAVAAILSQRPETARAKPASLVDEESDYRKLFSENYPVEMYYNCIYILKKCEAYLRSNLDGLKIKEPEVGNLKYLLAMLVGMAMVGRHRKLTPESIQKINVDKISDAVLEKESNRVVKKYKAGGANGKSAKSRKLTTNVLKSFAMQGNGNQARKKVKGTQS